ncbi:hypothetical protein [Salmonella phage NINP13076]|uniref:Uncharacterized protein n=1 Tax=Salmonella phage SalP219 TaxID=3158864 RepID=A0AAU7PIV1_9CAUD|nr:hypothetical protein [Salmonella phage NINP13076]
MIELFPGMKVHAKSVDVYATDGTVFTYSAPRGKKYALILMTDEDPRDDVDNLVKANEWIESLGWKHEGDD